VIKRASATMRTGTSSSFVTRIVHVPAVVGASISSLTLAIRAGGSTGPVATPDRDARMLGGALRIAVGSFGRSPG
jgi:hypothetical protein